MGRDGEERNQNILSTLLRFQLPSGKQQVVLAPSGQEEPSFRPLGARSLSPRAPVPAVAVQGR